MASQHSSYKGETLGHVHFGINYLNNPDSFHLGERVIVIGAGNSAMDVARTALRKGVRWLQCFSRTSTVAASQHEYNYALLEGVEFIYCKIPVEITDEGVIFADAEEKEDGTILQIPGSEKLYPADSVIISISQGPRNQLVNTTKGLEANQKGLLVADEEGHTSGRNFCQRRRSKRSQNCGRGSCPLKGSGRGYGSVYAKFEKIKNDGKFRENRKLWNPGIFLWQK